MRKLGLLTFLFCLVACDQVPSAASQEQSATDTAMRQLLRNQPVPVYSFSLERQMLIEIYNARQRATNTFSVVQSEYTGKILWSCPSIGFPIPYATQLTNPMMVRYTGQDGIAAVPQAEPNGLYTPAQADATWVPCVGPDGRVTPVYEEKHVSVFLQPMQEQNGQLTPVAGSRPSFSIPAREVR